LADIYTRIDGDPNFILDKIEITEDLEYLIIQIEMILFTRRGDVLGDDNFGASLDDLIFSTNLSGSAIENVVRDQIKAYIPLANTYNVDTRCEFYKGVEKDTAILDITVDGTTIIGMTFA
jgi:phage baseplate assembly protein W